MLTCSDIWRRNVIAMKLVVLMGTHHGMLVLDVGWTSLIHRSWIRAIGLNKLASCKAHASIEDWTSCYLGGNRSPVELLARSTKQLHEISQVVYEARSPSEELLGAHLIRHNREINSWLPMLVMRLACDRNSILQNQLEQRPWRINENPLFCIVIVWITPSSMSTTAQHGRYCTSRCYLKILSS